jgi:hypothetical protein
MIQPDLKLVQVNVTPRFRRNLHIPNWVSLFLDYFPLLGVSTMSDMVLRISLLYLNPRNINNMGEFPIEHIIPLITLSG